MIPALGRYRASYEHAAAARRQRHRSASWNLLVGLGKSWNLAPTAKFRVVQAPIALQAEEEKVCHIS